MEIIEIGAVEMDGAQYFPIADFAQFVRPTMRPELTDFCRELTTIKQSQIDRAPTFPDALDAFAAWLGDQPFKMCSWGDFDFELMAAECARHQVRLPDGFLGHLNLKDLYSRAFGTKPSIGLKQAMQKLGISFEGTMHRGLDDARNIASVAQCILMLDAS